MAAQAFKKCGLLPPDHQHIGSFTSNGINSEQIPGNFSILTISSFSPQESAQSERRFSTHFQPRFLCNPIKDTETVPHTAYKIREYFNFILNKGRRRYWLGFTGYALSSVATLLLLCFSSALAEDIVPLNSGAVEPSIATTEDFLKALKSSPRRVLHGLARFSRHLTQDERKRLEMFGIHVLEPYQRTTYWVSVTYPARTRDIQTLKLDMSLIRLHDEDRVHPKIWQGNFDDFSVALPGDQPVNYNYVVNSDGTLNLTLMFHTDVSKIEAKKVLQKYTQSRTPKSDVVWVVVMSSTAVRTLAAEDLVRWIDAGPLPFLPNNYNTRQAIHVDPVPIFSTLNGWNGSGVRIGIFDSGIDEGHTDFLEINDPLTPNRVTITRPAKTAHGTQIAATVAGNGKLSDQPDSLGIGINGTAFQWRGMAPSTLLFDESNTVGDDVSHHRGRIQIDGMHLSNHSYDVSFDGYYSVSDWLRDGIIRGSVPGSSSLSPRLHVLSAGNQGRPCTSSSGALAFCASLPFQTGYFSLTKHLKNGLVVGDWNHMGITPVERDRISLGSSLGPSHDGRIKPDVVAPGTDIVSSTLYSGSAPFYGGSSGTSNAAAAVTGSLALVLQQYASTYLVNLNQNAPLPSTLRAVMIHTAGDKKVANADPTWFSNADGPVKPTLGPDFVTGWGLVDAQKAAEVVKQQLLYEDTVEDECESKTYLFNVTTNDPIRVTLAWDDPPYSGPTFPITDRRLVNDLDLILINPSPNSQPHYSWKLDQKIVNPTTNVEIADDQQSCTTPIDVQRQFVPTSTPQNSNDTIPPGGVPNAVRGRDHLNNVEVVDVDAPAVAGVWQIRVIGFSIPMESQPFSLVGYRFYDVTPPHNFCNLQPTVCGAQSTNAMVAYRLSPPHNRITGRFETSGEKYIFRLTTFCQLGFTCPPCAANGFCPIYNIRLEEEEMASPLQVEVYTYDGKLVTRDTSAALTKKISFKGRPNVEYLLVLSPIKGKSFGKEYKVRLRITEK